MADHSRARSCSVGVRRHTSCPALSLLVSQAPEGVGALSREAFSIGVPSAVLYVVAGPAPHRTGDRPDAPTGAQSCSRTEAATAFDQRASASSI